jgi:RNA polymerase sigma factor (sigma-70 family)
MPPAATDLLPHLDWVRALCARLVFDPDRGCDLAQEVWHAALRRPAASGTPARAWLAGIAHHLAAMLHRGDVRRRRREQATVRTGEVASAALLAEQAELQERVLAAVNALPGPMRDVVLLRFLEDQPPRAIAKQLGVPVATVRTRLQRALARLREQLDGQFGDRRAWLLVGLTIPQPRHVLAAAGLVPTCLHLAAFVMHTKKLVAAAALLALVAIPVTLMLSRPRVPTPPDYGSTAPIAAAFTPANDTAPSDAAAAAARAAVATASGTLTGRVVDMTGAPIAGAELHPWPPYHRERLADDGVLAHERTATSAADGSFTFPPRAAEKWGITLDAEHADYVAIADGSDCRFGEPATIVMLRVHTVPLVVEVHDRKTGTPAPRFRVTGTIQAELDKTTKVVRPRQLRWPHEELGTNGVYRGVARFAEGQPFEVFVYCVGGGRSGWDDGTDPPPRVTLQPRPGEPIHVNMPRDFDAAEAIARTVQRGRIVAADTNVAIAGAELSYMSPDRSSPWYRWVQTRADGTFAIALPDDGRIPTLRIRHDDWQSTTAAPMPGEELVVRLQPRGRLTCRIVGGDGRPIPRAPLLITTTRDDASDARDRVHERRRSDERGEFHLTGLLARTYYVNVLRRFGDSDDHALATASYRVRAGEHLEVVLATVAGDTVHVLGTIVGGPDGLVPMFAPHAGERRWIRPRATGRHYDAGGVPRGDHLVLLVPADDGRRDLPTILLPRIAVQGLGTAAIDLLVPTGLVRGRVLATTALPPTARVVVIPDVPADGLAAEMLANPKLAALCGVAPATDGAFTVCNVADGACRLEVRDGAAVLASRAIDVRGSLDVGDWRVGQ